MICSNLESQASQAQLTQLWDPRLLQIIGIFEFSMVLLDFFGFYWNNWNFEGFSSLLLENLKNPSRIITFPHKL